MHYTSTPFTYCINAVRCYQEEEEENELNKMKIKMWSGVITWVDKNKMN